MYVNIILAALSAERPVCK